MAIKGIRVVHAMPGRVRLKVDKVKGDPEFAHKAQDRLGQVPGIVQVEAKPLTGSVLIHYDIAKLLAAGGLAALSEGFSELFPEIEADTIDLGLESLMRHLAARETVNPGSDFMGSMAALNAEVARIMGGLDLKLLVPLTLLFLGARSLWASKEKTFPAWYDYFWFAFSSFVMLNLRNVDNQQQQQ